MVKNHSLVAKLLHWGFIPVFAYGLAKQVGNVEELADHALLHFEMMFSIAFLVLLLIRYIYMRLTLPTALPEDAPRFIRIAARTGHLAIYISLAMIAISGMAIGFIFRSGSVDGPAMQIALTVHETSVMASYLTIGLHVIAAVYHRFKGDGIWSTMVPVWKEDKT